MKPVKRYNIENGELVEAECGALIMYDALYYLQQENNGLVLSLARLTKDLEDSSKRVDDALKARIAISAATKNAQESMHKLERALQETSNAIKLLP